MTAEDLALLAIVASLVSLGLIVWLSTVAYRSLDQGVALMRALRAELQQTTAELEAAIEEARALQRWNTVLRAHHERCGDGDGDGDGDGEPEGRVQ